MENRKIQVPGSHPNNSERGKNRIQKTDWGGEGVRNQFSNITQNWRASSHSNRAHWVPSTMDEIHPGQSYLRTQMIEVKP